MRSITEWKRFLKDQFEENPPVEYRTLDGRTLSIEDETSEFDVEFSESGDFQRLISYIHKKKQ